jgi:hypothetical protein
MAYSKHKNSPELPAAVILIKDDTDHVRNQKRMEITKDIIAGQGVDIIELSLSGDRAIERAFNSLLLADWTAYHSALLNGVNPEAVPIIEDFKKRMK